MPHRPDRHLLAKAETLTEALPYLKRHEGRYFVVKYGGHAMGNPALAHDFAEDIVLLKTVGINPVVVHGGGPQIGAMLSRLGIESRFVDGLRVTDRAACEVVEMVLSGTINKQLVTSIARAGGRAIGISGKDGDMVTARQIAGGKLGFVGEPAAIDTAVIETISAAGMIPVIAPIASGADGETYNINADTMAGAIAAAIGAARLFLLTDVPGVLDGNGTLMSELPPEAVAGLIAQGVIAGGMIPKLETCLHALEAGCEAAVVLDGRVPHAMLIEIFTAKGAGTLIRRG